MKTTTLEDLQKLIDVLRDNGVVEYEHDGTRLRIIPPMMEVNAAPQPQTDEQKKAARAGLLFAHELPETPLRRAT